MMPRMELKSQVRNGLDCRLNVKGRSMLTPFLLFIGRSYGGACCNAMLKVLYDAANEAIDAAQNNAEANDLFDDDDESLLERPVGLSRNRTFESLTLGDVAVPSSITWAELLRKMKAEVAEIEYSQSPTVTSSRRFDLNQPFSLIPESFDSETGKKRSLLIGCNYHDTPSAELKASHDDVRSMKVRICQGCA